MNRFLIKKRMQFRNFNFESSYYLFVLFNSLFEVDIIHLVYKYEDKYTYVLGKYYRL